MCPFVPPWLGKLEFELRSLASHVKMLHNHGMGSGPPCVYSERTKRCRDGVRVWIAKLGTSQINMHCHFQKSQPPNL